MMQYLAPLSWAWMVSDETTDLISKQSSSRGHLQLLSGPALSVLEETLSFSLTIPCQPCIVTVPRTTSASALEDLNDQQWVQIQQPGGHWLHFPVEQCYGFQSKIFMIIRQQLWFLIGLSRADQVPLKWFIMTWFLRDWSTKQNSDIFASNVGYTWGNREYLMYSQWNSFSPAEALPFVFWFWFHLVHLL